VTDENNVSTLVMKKAKRTAQAIQQREINFVIFCVPL